jgi:hypothetical protein
MDIKLTSKVEIDLSRRIRAILLLISGLFVFCYLADTIYASDITCGGRHVKYDTMISCHCEDCTEQRAFPCAKTRCGCPEGSELKCEHDDNKLSCNLEDMLDGASYSCICMKL